MDTPAPPAPTITLQDLDAMDEKYSKAVQLAEWNIDNSTEQWHWDNADHIWIDRLLMKKRREEQQRELDAMQADLLDTGQALEEMTRT